VLLLSALAASMGSCGRGAFEMQPDSPVDADVDALAEFQARLSREGSITFRSWDGRWIEGDCTTDLQFLPDQKAKLWEDSRLSPIYDGTYRVDDKGEVTASFGRFGPPWPVMILARDTLSLHLRPKDPRVGFVMGNRPGVALPAGSGRFWPFRPLESDR